MQRSFLRKTRKSRKLTLSEVAQEVGVRRSHLGHIEQGRFDPSLKLALKLEEFYGIPVSQLLKRDGE